MLVPLSIIFAAAFTAAVALVIGRFLFAQLGVKLHREEEPPLAFVAGAACLHLLLFVVLAAQVAYKPVLLGLGIAALLAAWRLNLWRVSGPRFDPLTLGQKRGIILLFGAFGILYFFNALAPESSPDGSGYHLGVVARYLREHGFPRITTNIYASLGQGIELLFFYAFAFGRHSAGAMVHLIFTAALAWTVVAYGRRIGRAWAGISGGFLVFASPVVGITGTSAYIDPGVAAILFAMYYLLQVWDEHRNPRILILVGLLAGYCFAAKYTAFLALPYAMGFVLWRTRRLKPAFLVAACAVVMIAPWLIKNWIVVENPFSPFLNRWFPNPYVHRQFEEEYRQLMSRYGVENKWTLPLEVTIRGDRTTGVIGAIFLLAPIALASLRFREGRRLLFFGFLILSTYLTNAGTRFLIPALPFFSLAMALAFGGARAPVILMMVAHAVLSWPPILKFICHEHAWRLQRIPIRQALRIDPQDRYLRENYSHYAIARMIDEVTRPGARILSTSGLPESYMERELLVRYQSAFNETLGDFLNVGWVEGYQPNRVLKFRFSSRPLRKIRAVQTGTGDFYEQWNAHELRVYREGAELPRSPEWRLRAKPNPWDVQLAFDNSPATRWRSWETPRPGMFLEIDFGKRQEVDELRIETSDGSPKLRVRIEGMDEGGSWTTLVEGFEVQVVQAPVWIRRAATREVKARGVDYILIWDSDHGAEDIRDDPGAWGLSLVRLEHGARLYRIEP